MNVQQEFIPRYHQPAEPKIRFHQHGENAYFGQAYSSGDGPSIQRDQLHATYSENVFYMNYTHQKVTLLKRDGLTTVIEPTSNILKSGFSICRVVTLRGTSLQAMLDDLTIVDRVSTSEMVALREAAKNLRNTNFIRELSILLEYNIPTQKILDLGGTIYHYQMDTIVSFKARQSISAHPYSPDAQLVKDFGRATQYIEQEEFNVKIRLVDHRLNAIPRYMRIAGKVIKLYPQKDMGYQSETKGNSVDVLENYVQVMYSARNDTSKIGQTGVESIFYNIEDARLKLGIFDHLSEAHDPERLRIEHTAAVQTAARELELLKAKVSREKLMNEQSADMVKIQLVERTQELESMKQEYIKINTIQKQKQTELDQLQERIDAEVKNNEERKRAALKEKELQTAKLEDHYKYREANSRHLLEMDKQRMQSSTDLIKWVLGFTTALTSLVALYYKSKTT